MTLAELRDKADAKLASFWTALVSRQEAYFAKHGRYFGLLVTSDVPVDGEELEAGTNISQDEEHAADYNLTVPSPLPFAIQVWQHGSAGFTAQVWVRYAGKLYSRIKSYGTVDNTAAWHVVTEE